MSPSICPTCQRQYDQALGPEPGVGDRLGPYYLQELVGEGGMGRVFRAVHEKLGRRVALKLIRRSVSQEDGLARFLREARTVNRVADSHIVEITDIVAAPPGGDSYYVMEWLEGKDLHARMIECGGRIPVPELVRLAIEIAGALQSVHQAGLVHRDIKPENIYLLERDGRRDFVKIIDFGIVKDAAEAGSEMADYIVGTPAYMAPEMVSGQGCDARSDVYSLGIVLYEMAVGRLPFSPPVTVQETLPKGARPPLVRPRQAVPLGAYIPRTLERVILNCVATRPEMRYASMKALRQDLEKLPSWEMPDPRRLLPVAVGVFLLGLASVGVWHGRARMHEVIVLPAPQEAPETPLWLEVEVRTAPPGAEVRYGGAVLGTTPCVVRLPEGSREVELHHAGYHDQRRTVVVRPGARLIVQLGRLGR